MPLSFEDFAGDDFEDHDNPIFSIALMPDNKHSLLAERGL
jgi:hypothetical protein